MLSYFEEVFGGASMFEYGLFQESDAKMEQIELIIKTFLDYTASIQFNIGAMMESSDHLN